MAERQLPEPSHASFLQLNINTRFSKSFTSQKVSFANPSDCSDGLESLNVVFDTGEKKAEWEERVKTRADELAALADAIKMLNDQRRLAARHRWPLVCGWSFLCASTSEVRPLRATGSRGENSDWFCSFLKLW